MSIPTSNEIVVVVNHPKNSDVFFFPADTSVRSHFLPSRSGSGAPPCLTDYMLKGIPGQRIHLDVKAKRGRITDALGDPQNKKFYEKLVESGARNTPVPVHIGQPIDDIVFENLTQEDVYTWMYWMRWMTDEGDRNDETGAKVPIAELVQGELPKQEAIIKSGKVRRPRYHGRDGNPNPFYELPKEEEAVAAGAKA